MDSLKLSVRHWKNRKRPKLYLPCSEGRDRGDEAGEVTVGIEATPCGLRHLLTAMEAFRDFNQGRDLIYSRSKS